MCQSVRIKRGSHVHTLRNFQFLQYIFNHTYKFEWKKSYVLCWQIIERLGRKIIEICTCKVAYMSYDEQSTFADKVLVLVCVTNWTKKKRKFCETRPRAIGKGQFSPSSLPLLFFLPPCTDPREDFRFPVAGCFIFLPWKKRGFINPSHYVYGRLVSQYSTGLDT